jgi:hypothetical protein
MHNWEWYHSDFLGDLWAGEVPAQKFPRLFSFARDESISVAKIMQAEDLDTLFQLPLLREAFNEMMQLQVQINSVQYSQQE